MEHDIHFLIREKIAVAESRPVRWNKERAWAMIRPGQASNVKVRRYYYAAALAMGLALLFYTWRVNHQRQLMTRIAALESSINNEQTSAIKNQPLVIDKEALCGEPYQINAVVSTKQGRHPVRKEVVADTPPLADLREAPVIVQAPPESSPVTVPEETRRVVGVIVGYIPKTQDVAETSTFKKRKFKLLKNRAQEYIAVPPELHLLTARIN